MSGNARSKNKSSTQDVSTASAFLQAEKQFKEKPEEWKVQKGRKDRQNKPKKPKDDRMTDLNFGRDQSTSSGHHESRFKGQNYNKRPFNNSNLPPRDERKPVSESNHSSNKRPNTGHDENKQAQKPLGLSYTRLQQISAKDSTDIIRTLANSRSGLEEFLSGNIKPDFMYLIVKILSKLTSSDWEENKEHVLLKATTPEFLKKITQFVCFLATDEQSIKRREETEQFFENLLTFFQAIMIMLPTFAAEHLLGPLRATSMAMGGVTEYQNVTLNQHLLEKMKNLMSDFEERKKEKEEREKVMEEQKEAVYPKPLGSIKNVPLFPRPEDIAGTLGAIVPNKVVGPYNNVDHYLDVQFRLLREDFISPVRQGINDFRVGQTGDKSRGKKKVNNLRIYRRVKFLKPNVIGDKVGYEVCFDPEKKIKVKWEMSKRFIYGSLLLFTTDNFHTFFLATVVKRDLAKLESNRTVSVILCDTKELAQDILSKEFLMAESEVYFEPYYNVLKALQRFDSDTFPMKKYLVYVNTKTEPPAYTRNGSDVYTISAGDDGVNGRKTIKLYDSHTWPSCIELGFDDSQLNAFKAALTNDLAVIQGPPGTGKTYLGLKIAAALLENSVVWNYDRKTPILVICYTNHALDQFLEGILQKRLTNNIVRIGGRSKSEILEPFNLVERRKSIAYYCPNHEQAALLKDLKREMSDIFETIKTLQDNLEHLEKNDGIVSLKTLRIVIRDIHQNFFKSNDELLEWLLAGVSASISSQNNLISTADKQAVRRACEGVTEDYGFDLSDFENVARLKEVLFDSIDLEEPEHSLESNSRFNIYFTCTLDELQKKVEDFGKLLESLPGSEGARETIRKKMYEAKKAESDLKIIFKHFYHNLKLTCIPSQEDTLSVSEARDLNTLNVNQRWILYKSWIEFLKSGYWMMIGKLEERYRRGARRYEEVRQFDDLRIVQQADVVGITTTTAARLQTMLRELKPKIVIVEEAAEVLEAHIVASLSVYCQHLILIGDHKQLRPSPSDYRLEKEYYLDVSLFERLVNNGVSFYTLSTQHRMRPEISRLLVPTIYNSLVDHPSTLTRDKVRGMESSLFFMTHNNFEEEVHDIVSKKNLFEARMVMLLARHLLLQGYRPDEITVLATYKGQMFLMKDEQRRLEISEDLLVTVVDNYQGEENKIILLSLVRSNADNKIGFLKTENRVCVALSRARDGLFVLGNMDCLTAGSVLWQKIKQSFVDQSSFGPALILRCETHRSQLTRVVSHNDFNAVMEGGCSQQCGEQLPCGHSCKSLCHVSKDRHIRYRCSEPCNRFLCADRHPCPKKCFQPCGECHIPMQRRLVCGHFIALPCCVKFSDMQCKAPMTVKYPTCGHEIEVECYRSQHKQCPKPCPFRLDCGHACERTCHVHDDPDHLQYVCPKPCARGPLHCTTESHKCPLPCFEKCRPCYVTVTKKLPCGHKISVLCSETDFVCEAPCTKELECGHQCKKLCFEKCYKEDCKVKVEKTAPLCGHKVKAPCATPHINLKLYCKGKCSVTLKCGHKCAKLCSEKCTANGCIVPTELPVALPCGHKGALLPCNMISTVDFYNLSDKEMLVQYCNEPCLEVLSCKHRCSGTCGQCMQGRIHKVCDESCGNPLICGHTCPVPCRLTCPPCDLQCQQRCSHSRCQKKCGEPCVPCKEPCNYHCSHSFCSKTCGDLCDRKPCTEPCYLTLPCKHPCVGFCGEPCPPCKQCNPEHYEEFFYTGEEVEEDAKWVLLDDCKHVVEVRILERWLGMNQEGSEIKLRACPKCMPTDPNRFISTTQRYMNLVKTTFKDIHDIKKKVFGDVQDIRNDRIKLLNQIEKATPVGTGGFDAVDKDKDELVDLNNSLLRDLPVNKGRRRNEIDIGRYHVLEFRVNFLITLLKRKEEIWSKLNDEAKRKMKTKVNSLTKALKKRDKKISQTEAESFDLELRRIIKYGDLLVLESSGEFKQLKSNKEVIECFTKAENLINQLSRYTDECNEKVSLAIKAVKDVIKSNASLSADEKKMIHMAMSKSFYGGFQSQGHWFKCPNGHLYTITECGGAMQRVRCPIDKCGTWIGGENHRYVDGIRLASDMDGATRPAWSAGNDMGNFRLDNIR